ncbi:MAG: Uma2 family endonuclease [Bacteroidota bacterium]
MSAVSTLKYTIEEYLEIEAVALEKHEFYQGQIIAMAAASIAHNQISRNTLYGIDKHLKESGNCEIFPSALKIHSELNSLFTYPDLSIICGEIETLVKHNDVVTNPSVLIEVLSLSTQDYDRGSKFKLYRDIPSLKEYVLISSLEVLVEKYDRQPDNTWILHEYKTQNDSFKILSADIEIQVDSLYRDVQFETKI